MDEPNRLLWDATFDCNDRGCTTFETTQQASIREYNHAKYLRLMKLADLELQRARANMENDQLKRFFARQGRHGFGKESHPLDLVI